MQFEVTVKSPVDVIKAQECRVRDAYFRVLKHRLKVDAFEIVVSMYIDGQESGLKVIPLMMVGTPFSIRVEYCTDTLSLTNLRRVDISANNSITLGDLIVFDGAHVQYVDANEDLLRKWLAAIGFGDLHVMDQLVTLKRTACDNYVLELTEIDVRCDSKSLVCYETCCKVDATFVRRLYKTIAEKLVDFLVLEEDSIVDATGYAVSELVGGNYHAILGCEF